MTVMTNGSRAAALEDARAGMSRPELAAKYDVSDGTAGNIIRASGRTKVRNGAADAVPSVATNGVREVPPVARSNGKSGNVASPVTSVKAQRKQRLFVAMIVCAAVVAGVVGTLSYSLIHDLAIAAGAGWHAVLLPLALDGMMICGALCYAVDSKYLPAKVGVGIGLAGSLVANGVAAHDPASVVDLEWVARGMAMFPPVALLVCIDLIVHAYKVRR